MKYVKNEFTKQEIARLSEKLAGKKALLALSGGVDSAVCAGLLHKAAPKSLTCVFVDTGLMRKGEVLEVKRVFGDEMGLNLVVVNAESVFLEKLKGVTDPEKKRKIIGEEFIRVFEKESKKIGAVDFLVQGTIYPDIAESGGDGHKNVKSHHNVGGLPSVIDFKEILEPLRDLYKDEVRKVGFELGLPKEIVMRQPFPGPGLAVRVIGEVTKERLNIVREADFVFRDEIKNAGLEYEIWQYFAVLTDIKSVGVRQGERTYENMIALRAVNSTDAMSATCAKIPADVLEKVSARIVNEVTGVNRVVYDITNKPPSTIEWE